MTRRKIGRSFSAVKGMAETLNVPGHRSRGRTRTRYVTGQGKSVERQKKPRLAAVAGHTGCSYIFSDELNIGQLNGKPTQRLCKQYCDSVVYAWCLPENVFQWEAAYERFTDCYFGVGLRIFFTSLTTDRPARMGQQNGRITGRSGQSF